ncbi:hypothetical protein PInf_022878 [Phytophthora infestans]|nr:hypothetical protein PInf_022878 [Phytophthora infestans]
MPAVPQPASTGPPPARTGYGKGKAKRVISTGFGLGSSEDDEDEGSDWSDGSGPPIRSSSNRTLSSGPYSFTPDDDDDDDDDDDESPEDSEEARVADDALEEDTRRALSQSRSEARRRSLSTPPPQVADTAGSGDGTAGSAIQVDSDGGSGSDGGGGSPHGGGSPGSALIPAPPSSSLPGMLPVARFGPDAAFILGRRAPVAFATRAIEPWSAKKLNRVAIVTMKITVLFSELPFRAEWIFPREASALQSSGLANRDAENFGKARRQDVTQPGGQTKVGRIESWNFQPGASSSNHVRIMHRKSTVPADDPLLPQDH